MPQFDAPEYASYVQLCKELRLKHEFLEGDLFVGPRLGYPPDWHAETPLLAGENWPSTGAVWLPQLADWRDMLEAKGYTFLELWQSGTRNGRPMYVCAVARADEEPPWEHTRSAGRWPTPEEAAARTYMAATGK